MQLLVSWGRRIGSNHAFTDIQFCSCLVQLIRSKLAMHRIKQYQFVEQLLLVVRSVYRAIAYDYHLFEGRVDSDILFINSLCCCIRDIFPFRCKVYDAFRPWTIQKLVKNNLKDSNFSGKYYCVTNQFPNNKNSNGSTRCLYEYKGWFIALRLSSHNVAKAVDVSMVTKDDNQEISTQTPMHELSGWAIPTNTEVNKYPSEIAMNSLFTNSGFHYLISEWWHFEDKGRYAVSGTEYLGADTKANHLELAK